MVSIETYVEGSGVTAAKVREELGLDLKGTVTSDVLVEVGDEVKSGRRPDRGRPHGNARRNWKPHSRN